MKTCGWQAILVIISLAGLALCACTSADEPSVEVSASHIPHPSELWPMPEDNGGDDLLAAIELLPDQGTYSGPDPFEILDNGVGSYTDSQMQAFLRAYEPAVDELRQALSKPFVIPYQRLFKPSPREELLYSGRAFGDVCYSQLFEPHPWDGPLSEIVGARLLAWVLIVQAAYCQHRADHHQALDNLQHILALRENLSRGGLYTHRLVTLAIKAIGLSAWKDWLVQRPPTEMLHRGSQFLQQFEQQQVPLWKTIVMQYWMYREDLEDRYTFPYPRRFTPEQLAAIKQHWPDIEYRLEFEKNDRLRRTEVYFAYLLKVARNPLKILDPERPQNAPRAPPSVANQWTTRVVAEGALAQTSLRGVRIMIAIEQYRRRQPHQDRYPPTLQDLVPNYLSELPKDPYTGEDFIYVHPDKLNYKLYSVGSNRVDEGGAQKGETWRPNDLDVVVCEMK